MSRKDVVFLAKLAGILAGLMVLLFVLLIPAADLIEKREDQLRRCDALGGEMTRDWECVQPMEGY